MSSKVPGADEIGAAETVEEKESTPTSSSSPTMNPSRTIDAACPAERLIVGTNIPTQKK